MKVDKYQIGLDHSNFVLPFALLGLTLFLAGRVLLNFLVPIQEQFDGFFTF